MTRYREHWDPAHPAVRAWINEHPHERHTLRYRRAMSRHRLGLKPARNRDRGRQTVIISGVLLATALVEKAPGYALAVFAVVIYTAWPLLVDDFGRRPR